MNFYLYILYKYFFCFLFALQEEFFLQFWIFSILNLLFHQNTYYILSQTITYYKIVNLVVYTTTTNWSNKMLNVNKRNLITYKLITSNQLILNMENILINKF